MDELRRHVEGPLLCVNRLDRGCSGAVLLARDTDTAAMMQAHWHDATTHKTYRALVRGHVAPGVVDVDHPLTDEHGVTRDAHSRVTPVENLRRASWLA